MGRRELVFPSAYAVHGGSTAKTLFLCAASYASYPAEKRLLILIPGGGGDSHMKVTGCSSKN